MTHTHTRTLRDDAGIITSCLAVKVMYRYDGFLAAVAGSRTAVDGGNLVDCRGCELLLY